MSNRNASSTTASFVSASAARIACRTRCSSISILTRTLRLLVHSTAGERIPLQQRLRVPNLLLARLLRRCPLVAGRAVDGHFATVTASDHADELLGHVTIRVNKPAAIAMLPDSQALQTVTSDVLI